MAEDYTYTVNSTNDWRVSVFICNDDDSNIPNCSDYEYIYIHDWTTITPSARYTFSCYYNSGSYQSVGFFSNGFLLNTNSCIQIKPSGYSNSFGEQFKFTLTNNNPFSGTPPSGSFSITQNGTYDVTNYAEAVVNVPPEVVQGDYHDDLLNINQSILIGSAVLLMLYFFWCIYRMIIKTVGGV